MISGTIFDIKRMALNDGPGIRVTIFFKGCPLSCWWCHNPEGRSPDRQQYCRKALSDWEEKEMVTVGREATVEEVMDEIVKEKVFMDQSGGGVTFSGGEPLMQADFLGEILKQCRKAGIHTAIDTSGYAPMFVMKQVLPLADLFLFDLKIIDSEIHQTYTGVSNENIIENLRLLESEKKDTVIRIPLIPGITDTIDNILGIKSLLKQMNFIDSLEILPFHRMSSGKYRRFDMEYRMQDVEEPLDEDVECFMQQFLDTGLQVSVNN